MPSECCDEYKLIQLYQKSSVWCFASSHTSTFELIPAVATAQPGALVTVYMCTRWKVKVANSLTECLAATVWAARHHSDMHRPPLAAPEPGDTDWNLHAGTCLSENSEMRRLAEMTSDWNVVNNQQSFIDRAVISGEIVLVRVSKPKATLWTFVMMCFYVNVITFKAYVTAVKIDLCFVSQGRVSTAVRTGEQFCCKCTSVSVRQKLSKYQHTVWQSYCKKIIAQLFTSQCKYNIVANIAL